MKIAVTYENGQVFQHFGHTEQFKIYTVDDENILTSEIVNMDGTGHGALAISSRREASTCSSAAESARAR